MFSRPQLLTGLMSVASNLISTNVISTYSHRYKPFLSSCLLLLFISPILATAQQVNTPGKFEVKSNGSANYEIPITVSPGKNQIAPTLSLNYNNLGSNGYLGYGWGLNGLSEISRCPRTLVVDGVRGSVGNNANDRFCLDGQRLLTTGGVYGADGTEYRTETANFAKVISYGTAGTGPAWFKVWTKDGRVFEYGNTADSRIEVAGGSATVRTWAVNKISDLFTNYMTFSYQEDNTTGEVYVSRIDYTGNQNTTTLPYASVRFSYTTRPDPFVVYQGGGMIRTTKRMSAINTYVGESVIRSYKLEYSDVSTIPMSRLTTIKECDASGTNCLLPTTVNYPTVNDGVFEAQNLYSDQILTNTRPAADPLTCQYLVDDVNADGASDVTQACYWLYAYSKVLGLTPETTISRKDGAFLPIPAVTPNGLNEIKIQLADIHGDSKLDAVGLMNDSLVFEVNAGNGDGTYGQRLKSTLSTESATGYRPKMADVNGDGRADFVATYAGPGGLVVKVAFSNGNGTFSAIQTSTLSTTSFGAIDNYQVQMVDINEDGMVDAVITYIGTGGMVAHVALSNGDGTFGALVSNTLSSANYGTSSNYEVKFGDVNGDGKPDFVASYAGPGGASLDVAHATGNGSFGPLISSTISTFNYGTAGVAHRVHLADINGDGKADAIIANNYSGEHVGCRAHVFLSKGDGGFSSAVVNNLPSFVVPSSSGSECYSINVNFSDITGDGKADYVGTVHGGAAFDIFPALSPSGLSYMATSINNGLSTTSVTYKSISGSGSNYTKDTSTTSTYPVLDVQMPLYVVASVLEEDGIGSSATTSYEYGGLKNHINGRGLLGFRWMKTKSTDRDEVVTRFFKQDFPYIGLPSQIEKRQLSSNTLLAVEQITYNTLDIPVGSLVNKFPYQSQVVKQVYELDGSPVKSATTTNQYDNYGNLTQSTTTDSEGYSVATTSSYLNNESSWIIGKPLKSSVTASQPSETTLTKVFANDYNATTGALTKEIIEPGSSVNCLVKAYGYDSYGNRNTVTARNCNGSAGSSPALNSEAAVPAAGSDAIIITRTTTINYDAQGRFPNTVVNGLSQTETHAYDSRFGSLTTLTDPNTLSTGWSYDGFGRVLTESHPDGTSLQTAYAVCDSSCPANGKYKITATQAGMPTTIKYYDMYDRVIQSASQDKDGAVVYVQTDYDHLGHVRRTSKPARINDTLAWTTIDYDKLDRPVATTYPDNTITSIQYSGLTTITTDARNHQRFEITNARGKTVFVMDGEAVNYIIYKYDTFGNLTKTTDPAGNVIESGYDIRGRKTAMNDPDLGNWTYAYDALGQLKRQTNAKSQVVTFTYDKLNRITNRSEPDLISTWTYDICDAVNNASGKCIGKAVKESADNGYSRSYYYDSFSRMFGERDNVDSGFNVGVSKTFDTYGRVSQLQYPNNLTIKNVYSTTGHLIEVRNASSNALYWQVNTTDAAGRITQETYGNGIVTNHTYHVHNGLETQITAGPNGSISNQSFVYDNVGNLTQRYDAATGLNESFGYDYLNRLETTSAQAGSGPLTQVTLTYSQIGNILTKSDVGTYTYGTMVNGVLKRPHAVNGITKPDGSSYGTYTYDNNGNTLTGAGRTMVWKSWDEPTSITKDGKTVSFLYNSAHERVKETTPSETIYNISPRLDTGIHVEKRVFNPFNAVQYMYYLYAGSMPFGTVSDIQLPGETTFSYREVKYFHKDHLGSIIALTDEGTNVTERRSYDAWGKRRNLNGTALATVSSPFDRHGYTGHEELFDVGVIHMNGRVYDPAINRFLSVDPVIQDVKNLQSYNAYSYLNNNPLNATDPSGYEAVQMMPGMTITGSRGGSASSWGDSWGSSWGGIGSYGSANAGLLYTLQGAWINLPGQSTAPTLIKKSESKKSIGNGKGLLSIEALNIDFLTPTLPEVDVTGKREGIGAALLVTLYSHFQIGGGKDIYLDTNMLNFSNTSQRQLGLTGIAKGERRGVNLFKSGINANSLAFGKLDMKSEGNNLFSISPDRFDFNYEFENGFTARNMGTLLGAAINYNLYAPSSILPFIPATMGGPFTINFQGTVYIPPR